MKNVHKYVIIRFQDVLDVSAVLDCPFVSQSVLPVVTKLLKGFQTYYVELMSYLRCHVKVRIFAVIEKDVAVFLGFLTDFNVK